MKRCQRGQVGVQSGDEISLAFQAVDDAIAIASGAATRSPGRWPTEKRCESRHVDRRTIALENRELSQRQNDDADRQGGSTAEDQHGALTSDQLDGAAPGSRSLREGRRAE